MKKSYEKVFEPIQIGPMLVKNRIETAPAAPRLANNDGTISPELLAWSRELAKGGAGIVTLGISGVTPLNGMGSGFCVNMGSDNVLVGLTTFAEEMHRYGAKASVELGAFAFAPPGQSAIDLMSQADIDGWIAAFSDAAERAAFCGMDMVLLHGGHGILISNFFSPLFNHRTDKYGGSIANRARFACELVDEIRRKTKNKLAIEFRISAEELVPGGVELPETIEFVKVIEDKIDLLHVSAGMLLVDDLVPVSTQPSYFKRGYNVHYAASLKKAGIKVPITTVGSIDLDLAEQILENGEADMCAMIRTVIADPFAPEKARLGQEEDIRPCIRCVVCLNRTHGMRGKRVACAVNPRAGREVETDIALGLPVTKKKVVIVGGGPAGMEAARTAADRGHDVVLFEKTNQLGGTLHLAVRPEFKADLKDYLDWAIRTTEADSRIIIRKNTEATEALIQAEHPDAVFVAIGAEPNLPPIPGLDGKHVVWVGDVESGKVSVGNKVVIAGGGLTGCENALVLAREGKEVTLVEMVSEAEMIASNPVPMTAILQLLKKENVTILTQHKLISAAEHSVTLECAECRQDVPFDTLVVSLGVKPKTAEAAKFAGLAEKVVLLGDCTTSQGTLLSATLTGSNAAMDL